MYGATHICRYGQENFDSQGGRKRKNKKISRKPGFCRRRRDHWLVSLSFMRNILSFHLSSGEKAGRPGDKTGYEPLSGETEKRKENPETAGS